MKKMPEATGGASVAKVDHKIAPKCMNPAVMEEGFSRSDA